MGWHYQIKQANSNKVLWELQGTNAKGQLTPAKLGAEQIINEYDSFGFLTREKHISNLANLMEVYTNNKIKFDLIKN